MAQGVVTLNQGFDYQARVFWIQASRLFMPGTQVVTVGFEVDHARGFDDVSVVYDGAVDEHFAPLRSDHYSVKFHVDQSAGITYEALTDPAFINATSESFLQKLHRVQRAYAPDGTGARFYLVSPWRPVPGDALGDLFDTATGGLRIDKLFGDRKKRLFREVRRTWAMDLNLEDEEELRVILRPLRFQTAHATLADLTATMSRDLREAGFRPIEEPADVSLYDDLPYKLVGAKRREFGRDELERLARIHGVWVGRPTSDDVRTTRQVAVRSFMRGAERLHEQVEDITCVSHLFSNRQVSDPRHWNETILSEVEQFTRRLIAEPCVHHLHLPAHGSIAFAVGYHLDAKTGAEVYPVQTGRGAWVPDARSPQPPTETLFDVTSTAMHAGGDGVAVALSITHDVAGDVEHFVRAQLPGVGRLLHLRALPEPNPSVVRDATHALHLAQAIVAEVRRRSAAERQATLHLFFAAPTALAFFLGQRARGFGPLVLYEYAFDSNLPGGYNASIRLPSTEAGAAAPVNTESR